MVPNYMNGSLYGPKPILLFCWQFEIEESPHGLKLFVNLDILISSQSLRCFTKTVY
jgi:hypothetical protein